MEPWFLLFSILYGVILSVLAFNYLRRKRIVKKTSEKIKKLFEVNAKYTFRTDIKNLQLTHSLSTKAQYDKYQVVQLLNYAVLFDENVIKTMEALSENKDKYASYCEEIKGIESSVTRERARKAHISFKQYQTIEEKLFSKKQLKPVLDCSIRCDVTYSSPKGRNHYAKWCIYSAEEAFRQRDVLNKYIARERSAERQKQLARSQMTDKLRYSILKRDGFRCKICGRSAEDGVKLHVDHIIPVSKGGRTTPDNLRTLCEQCNMGKSDELE